jgi:sugar phosphate isomerase/epimerase
MSKLFPYGICIDNSPIDQVDKGFTHFEVPNAVLVKPFDSDGLWSVTRDQLLASGRKMHSCSHYIQEFGLKANGPLYDRDQQIFWAQRSFKRMNELGIKVIGVYGAFFDASEKLKGYSKTKAMDDAISFANIIADEAEKYGMEIALEPMAKSDTLWPSYLDGLAFCKQTGRRSMKLMADLNYFLAIGQPLEDILKAPEYCLNVHIQGDGGSQPNVGKRDEIFLRLFKILKEIKYKHVVTSACPWVATKKGEFDWRYETKTTVEYLDGLMEKV